MTSIPKTDSSDLDNPVCSVGAASQTRRLVPVLEGFALWAPTYGQTPNPLLALEERVLRPLLPALADKFVFDVACGTGRWIRKLMSLGARAGVGLDLSFDMLALGSSKTALSGKLIQGHACAMPIQSGVADVVVNSFSTGYIGNLRAFASELTRVTRPDAQVFVSDFHPSAYLRGWRRTFRSRGEVIEISSRRRSLKQICKLFESLGLTLERSIEPSFGEPERSLFERAGRGHLFDSAREGPAIFICEFRRTHRPSE